MLDLTTEKSLKNKIEDLVKILKYRGCKVSVSGMQDAVRINILFRYSKAILDVFATGVIRIGGKKGKAMDIANSTKKAYIDDPQKILDICQQHVKNRPRNQ